MQNLISARADLARNNPDLVRSFLRAHLAAVRWIDGHQAEARSLIARSFSLDEGVSRDLRMPQFVADARVDAELVATVRETLAAEDPTALPVKPEDLYDERLLLEVLDENG